MREGGGSRRTPSLENASKENNVSDDKIKWDQVDKWVARQGLKTTWKPYGMPEVLDPFTSRFADVDPLPKWDIPKKVMIAATITGAFFSKRSNPNQPITVQEIRDSAEEPSNYVLHGSRANPLEAAVTISVAKRPGANAIDVVNSVLARVTAQRGTLLPADVGVAVRAMKAGALDVLEKPFELETLLEALQAAARQHPPGVSEGELATFQKRLQHLTEREREVLEGLIAGQPAKVIAARCGISPSTVHVHRTHIAAKLGVKGLSRLVHLALAAGLGFDRDKWS